MSRTKYMRIQEKTHRAVNRIIGKLQLETGESYSADRALQYLIMRQFPDIAKEEALINEDNQDNKDNKDNG